MIKLSHGGGGIDSQELFKLIRKKLRLTNNWKGTSNDSSFTNIREEKLFFTTDSYTVNPIFFPGGNIGKLAICGTINDLAVMGAKPIGISLSLIIEEGFSKKDLETIIDTINEISIKTNIPIVTGDTKVMESKKIDKIVINTSGIGLSKKVLNEKLKIGDKIIVSGPIGEHAVSLLSKRFDFKTSIKTDAKPVIEEITKIKHLIKQAKDPTRGGLAAVLNEICEKEKIGMLLIEENIPIHKEVKSCIEMLGLDPLELACEGRFVCFCSKENEKTILEKLREYNNAQTIGEITNKNKVIIQTKIGKRIQPMPSGNIVPRIC